jgi:hypothetical protein
MGTVGKVLVLLHGALSIGVLAWAVGVYTQRINWNNPPGGAAGDEGIYAKQKAKADDYTQAANRAYTRWSGNLSQVQVLEAERYPRRAFYSGQLALVQTGTFNKMAVPNPIQQLVIAPNGFLNVTQATGRPPVFVRGMEPADSIEGYERKMAKLIEDTKASQVKNGQAITGRETLNREIIGVTQPAVVKGLRTYLNEQKLIEDRANQEDGYVNDATTNREAEFGLLKKRRDAMTARVGDFRK